MSYHDLFLSYNRADKEPAAEIAEVLRRFGFNVYFDHLAGAGHDARLHEALKREIDCSRCFALLHGRHGLGATQREEAVYAMSRIPSGLVFKNVLPGDGSSDSSQRAAVPAEFGHFPSIEGSHFLLVSKLVEWLENRIVEKGPHLLVGFGRKHTLTFNRIVQPDPDSIYQLDWRTFELLLAKLGTTLERANIVPDLVVGVNEGGLVIATFLAHKLHRIPLGYVKHAGGAPPRKLLKEHFALPKLASQPSTALLVDSELKTGGALKAIVPALRECYPSLELSIYYAALFAQLNERHWKDDKLERLKDPVSYDELLAAQDLHGTALKGVFFGGLFGEGRLNPPLGIR